MGEKRSISESKKISEEKKSETKKRLDKGKKSADNVSIVMKQVAAQDSSGFSDTDNKILKGAEKIGENAKRVGDEDSKHIEAAIKDVTEHSAEMDNISKLAEAGQAKAEKITSDDSRLKISGDMSSAYKEAKSVSKEISNSEKKMASASKEKTKSLLDQIKADSKKRPSFR